MNLKWCPRFRVVILCFITGLPALRGETPTTVPVDSGPVKLDSADFTVKIRPELLGQHPRIFFTASELEGIKQKVHDPKLAPMLKWFMDDADKTLAMPVPATAEESVKTDIRHNEIFLEQLAFAYLITGDAKYLTAEKNLIHAITSWSQWGDDLGTGHLLFGLSMAYDWLYKDLSPTERQEIETALLTHGRQLLRDPATGKAAWWNTSYFQNHCWINHTGISTAAMALYDLHPKEMQSWLDDSRSSFQATYKNLGLDGGYHEGASYARYGTTWLLNYVDSLRHMTGENLFDMPFLTKSGNYFCNTVMPDWANLANFGDCPPTAWGYPLEDNVLVKLAAEYHDGHLIWLRDHNRPFYGKSPSKNLMESPFALIWVDPSVAPKPLDDLPLVGLFPDLGLVVARTSWKDDAAVIALHCGAPGGQHLVEMTPKIKNATANNGHTHPDANSFVFWADHGWRIGLPGAYTYVKATHNENTWLVSGKGQRGDNLNWFDQKSYMGKSDQAHLVTVASTPEADYVVGEAAPAYPEECGLTQFRRHLLFVKGATPYVVVLDQLAAKTPQTWASYLHTYGSLTATDNSVFEMSAAVPSSNGPILPTSPTSISLFSPGKLDATVQPLMVLREHTKEPSAHGFELMAAPEGSSSSTWMVTTVGTSKDVHLIKQGPSPEITVGTDHIAWNDHDEISLNGKPITGNLLPSPGSVPSASAQSTLNSVPLPSHGGFILQNLTSLLLAQTSSSPELISNSDFANGTNDWQTQKLEDGQATFDVKTIENGKHALVVTVPEPATKRYYVQVLHSITTMLSAGKTYTLSFRAKSTPDTSIVAVIRSTVAADGELLRQDPISLTANWQKYSFNFTPAQDTASSGLTLSGLAAAAAEYSFTDVSLKESSAAPADGQATAPAPAATPSTDAASNSPVATPPPVSSTTQTADAPVPAASDALELMTNPAFDNGIVDWTAQQLEDGKASFEVKDIENGKHALCVTVTQAGTKRYYVQFLHPIYSQMSGGQSYTLSFRAKSKPAGSITLNIHSSAKDPGLMVKEDPIELTEDWQTYTYTYNLGQDCNAAWLTVSGLAAATGEYWFTDFSLKEASGPGATSTPTAIAPATPTEKTPTSIPGAEAHVYRDGSPDPMRLFVFKPEGWKATDHRPALVFFFGGGWTHGSPAAGADFAHLSTAYGMVGIAPDYRTKTRFGTSPLESVADGRASLHWVQEHAAELGIDPSRIIVGGHSAGGHVALWTAITKTPPNSDPNEAPTAKPAALFLLAPVSDTSPTGYTPFRFGENAVALSPVHQLDGKMPPTLLVHADTDKVVPYKESVALNAALIKNGAVCEFDTVPNGTHSFPWETPDFNTHKLMERLMAFLKTNGISIDPVPPAAK